MFENDCLAAFYGIP